MKMDVPHRRWVFDKAKVIIVLFMSLIISTNFEVCRGWEKISNIVGKFTNIDSVLDNYGTPSVRPGDGGNATVVNLGLHVTRLHSVQEIDMEMRSTLILYASWYDKKIMDNRFAKDVTNVVGDSVDKLWKPDIYFANGKNVDYDLVPTKGRIVKVVTDGNLTGVFYIVRIHLVSSCPMNLEFFPFDKQSCSIILASTGYTKEDVLFQWFDETEHGFTPVKIDLTRLAQFRVSSNFSIDEYDVVSEIDKKNISYVSTTVTLHRDPVYYFWSYYLPSSLIVILSWVNFYIDVDAAPARISLGTTLVLTVITLIGVAREQLPKIAYPTAMTVWLDAHGIFVVLALVEYAISHQLNYHHKLQTMIGKKDKVKKSKKQEEHKDGAEHDADKHFDYMSGYSKEIYEEFHMDTTHTGGSTIIGGIVSHIVELFKGRGHRPEDYTIKEDSERGPKKKQLMGTYRWWAFEIDYLSRFIFPAVYFTGVVVYVCSYRVWAVFLQEIGYRSTD